MENTRVIFTIPVEMKKKLEQIAYQQSNETQTVSLAQLLRMGAQKMIEEQNTLSDE